MLRAQLRIRVPARIEEHQQRPDVMLRRNRQKGIQPLSESLRILLPKLVLQKHPHRVHADPFGQPQLLIDQLGLNVAA